MNDITYIITGLILIVGGVLIHFILPALQSKVSADQIGTLQQIVKIAVYAAEQLFGAKMGEDKLAYALDYSKNLLSKYKLNFDEEAIRAAVEAQVKELKINSGAQK